MLESNASPVHFPFVEFIIVFFSAEGSYREGDIRLVGGPHNWEGRVEIFWNGTWGTISGSQWTNEDASVIRRQLQHMLPGYGKFKWSGDVCHNKGTIRCLH